MSAPAFNNRFRPMMILGMSIPVVCGLLATCISSYFIITLDSSTAYKLIASVIPCTLILLTIKLHLLFEEISLYKMYIDGWLTSTSKLDEEL